MPAAQRPSHDVSHPRLTGPTWLVVLGAGAASTLGLVAAIGYTAGDLDRAALGLPALYAVGVASAGLTAYLLASRARVVDDAHLRWAAGAYALAAGMLACLALAAPGFLALDVRLPAGATPNGSALLRLSGLAGVALFMLGGFIAPAARAALLGAAGAASAALFALILWAPDQVALPVLVTANGHAGAYRVLGGLALLLMLAAAAGWVRRLRAQPTWTAAWVAASLVCLSAHLALTGLSAHVLSVGWWAGLGLLLGGVLVPAFGLLADVPRQFRELHQHAVGLQEFLDHELELVAGTRVDVTVVSKRVSALLDSGEFHPVFQPIYDLDTLRTVGAEALTRFDGDAPEPPGVWFGWAKEAGLSVELEMATARTALAYMANIPSELYVSVNLSPETIRQRLVDEILDVVPPHRLVLEVTEHEAIDSYDELNAALGGLRRRGVRLAVDDAGAGFSSLRHIVLTAPDVIKLDISLVHEVDHDPVRRALTSSLVTFARQIGALIVAEGIETAEELRAVRDLGVGYGQGFYLARPGHVDALLANGEAIDLTDHDTRTA